jgi:hypothetical protein
MVEVMDWMTPQFLMPMVVNVATFAYVIGSYSTRIAVTEKHVQDLQNEVKVLRDLHAEMATIQTELKNVNMTLLRFEQYLTKGL